MLIRSTTALLAASLFAATPAIAQPSSEKDANAHHYQGGPQTGVPHSAKHTKPSNAKASSTSSNGHHYEGGPKTESHHMGEKK
jgi:hypothetical protein